MQKHTGIIIIFISIAFILVAGCTNTSPAQNQVTTTVQTSIPTSPTSSLTPITTVQTTAGSITTATSLTVNTTTTIIPQTTQTLAEIPYINILTYSKNAFWGHIHNCEMEEIFPTIAKDPYYGMRQKPPKISAISSGEFNVFLRDYVEGKNENQKVMNIYRCEGRPVTPYWNFVKIDVKITPRNGRPANYTMTINIRSQGKIIAQFNSTEMLTLDEIISFQSYIPLKSDEMDDIEGVELTWTKLPK